MPRLIWVFAGCTLILFVLSCRGSFTFLYAFETLTLSTECKRTQALKTRCYRRLWTIPTKTLWRMRGLQSPCEEWRGLQQDPAGLHDDLVRLTMVKQTLYDHISSSSGIAKTILQRTVKEQEENEDRSRDGMTPSKDGQGKGWRGIGVVNSLREAEEIKKLKGIVATSSVVHDDHEV